VTTPVEIFEEFLDLDRFPGALHWQRFLRFYTEKYRGQQPDIVVAVGTAAFEFALDHLRGVMPRVPIVFGMTYAQRVNVADLPENVTGRTVSITLGQTLAMAIRLQPHADRVVVIAGSSPIDSAAMSDALADEAAHRHHLRVERWQGFAYDSLLRALRALTPRTIVYFAHLRRDGQGRIRVPIDVVPDLARASGAPIYGFTDKLIGTGVVGGAMWRHDEEAVQTGLLAARVLRRETGARFPSVESAPTTYMADWRELHRFRLDASRLDPDTEVLFRTPSLWERHRRVILPSLGVILLESLLIGLLLLERRRRIDAQRVVAAQARYERTMAELATDAAHYASAHAPRALQDAIGRLGRYAIAEEVVLVHYSHSPSHADIRFRWVRGDPKRKSTAATAPALAPALELPLVVAGEALGLLTLRRAKGAEQWEPQLVRQLAVASEVVASAIVRSHAALQAEEAARQIAHMGRVAMVGELASTISHELRQPLAAIRINVEAGKQLLAQTPPDAEQASQVLQDIATDNGRATDVLEHIRLLLRKDAPESAAVSINLICDEAADLIRLDAVSRGIRLEVALDARLPLVEGHPIELQQVVLNLLINALDAAAMSSGQRWVAVETAVLDGRVEIVVRDSGPGLSPEARDRLFESFFTTKPHGLGMGLVIVRSIVERLQGRIQVDEGDEGGATFRVRLPGIGVPAVDGHVFHPSTNSLNRPIAASHWPETSSR
jgi:C4-dicarboxylate-specific signal transduction histidine kinase/ABC-type uncharacterized transport system substrate-binding protein